MQEVQAVGTDPAEFKNHQLPLARIKKVRRPVLFPAEIINEHSIKMMSFMPALALEHAGSWPLGSSPEASPAQDRLCAEL